MRRLAAMFAVLAVFALGASACGVPADEQARTLGTPPFGLLTTSTSVAPTTVPPEEGFRLTLYWVNPDEQIVPGEPIGLPEPPTFQTVLDLLTEGPPVTDGTDTTTTTSMGTTATTTPAALRTFITEGLNPEGDDVERQGLGPLVIGVEGGTIDVLMADRFRDESGATPARFRLGIAQIVCTLTQFPNADTVRFFDSRGQLPLVNLESAIIEVATRENIGQCDPPEPPAPTTTSTTARSPRPSTTSVPARRMPPRPGARS